MGGQPEPWQLQPSAQSCHTSTWGTLTLCNISGFHCILVEAFALLGCYTVEVGSWLLMCQDNSMFIALISAASFSAGSKWTKKFRYQVHHVVSSVIIVSGPDVFLSSCSSCNLKSVTAWTANRNRFDVTGIKGQAIIQEGLEEMTRRVKWHIYILEFCVCWKVWCMKLLSTRQRT